jgi:hypothetical protein
MKTHISLKIKYHTLEKIKDILDKNALFFSLWILGILSMSNFMIYFLNGLGLAYNDARSHLDIGRRVVEGLKPGFAQLGSVWLPLPHLLMVPTIWSDFMWHSGLSGAIQSMISYIVCGLIIYVFLQKLGVGVFGRLTGVLVFALNTNILYLQSTAMTELLLLATLTAAIYELVRWHDNEELLHLIKAAFLVMMATLIRYEGWFLFPIAIGLVSIRGFRKYGFKSAEGMAIFFATLAGFGIFLWFLWNQLIFKDALYFAFGPYSAHEQQAQLEHAGVLATKHNLLYSIKIYTYATVYNTGAFTLAMSIIGGLLFWFDKKIKGGVRFASLALLAPFAYNILALYLGHSVLFVQGLSGNSWFNVRYGVMLIPAVAIMFGYLVHRVRPLRYVILGLFLFTTAFSFINLDAVTIDDARVGSSGKNVTEVSGWLHENAYDKEGFVLISAASHDAIIFSSGLPMRRFIHEGTGKYWDLALAHPEQWARWIIMRTNDNNDQTFRLVKQSGQLDKYQLVNHFPFADIYEIKPQYVSGLITKPVLTQK